MKKLTLVLVFSTLIFSCSNKPETSRHAPIIQQAKIETVKPSTVDDYYEAVGTVRARTSTVISARIMGSILALHVREGDSVRQGQMLIEIENRDATIQVQKSQAGLREAQDALDETEKNIRAAESAHAAAQANEALSRSTLNRYEALFARQSVSPQEFDQVRTRYEVSRAESTRAERLLQAIRAKQSQVQARIDQAKADVANARVFVGYARIVAPTNGIVVSKQAEVGNLATPGAPLLTIEDNSRYQLETSVEESQLRKIQLHDRVQVLIAAIGEREQTGDVAEIIPAADPASRSYIVKVSLTNVARAQLHSGLYGKARFASGQRTIVAIPQKALTQIGQLVGVFVVDSSGIARLRLIKTGKLVGDRVEVLSGLSDGEQIVVEDVAQLKDGTRVREGQQIAAK